MRLLGRLLVWIFGMYAGWLAMMALHEAGHVLHAVATGARVDHVEVPLL